MKTTFLCSAVLVFLSICNSTYAQNEQTKIYEVRNNIVVDLCNEKGVRDTLPKSKIILTKTLPYRSRIAVVKNINNNRDTVLIRFLTPSKDNTVKKEKKALRKMYRLSKKLSLESDEDSSFFIIARVNPNNTGSISKRNLIRIDKLSRNKLIAIEKNYSSILLKLKLKQWYKKEDSNHTDSIKKLSSSSKKDTTSESSTNKNTNLLSSDTKPYISTYYLMSRTDLDSGCIKYYQRNLKSMAFTIGLVTMPVKIRTGKNRFDFQGNLSLGTTAGGKMRISNYNPNYVDFLAGVSISTVTLDSFSTRGKISGQPINNVAVFSPSLGIVFEFGRAQAGVFYGWDFLNSSMNSKYTWIYNKRSWLSVGFGFSIFSVSSPNTAASKLYPDDEGTK